MPNSKAARRSRPHGTASRLPRRAAEPAPNPTQVLKFVALDPDQGTSEGVSGGVLNVGDIGVVVVANEARTTSPCSSLVQELSSGRISWYPEKVLKPVAQRDVPEELLHNHPDSSSDGCYVTLAPDYRQHDDAPQGPLGLQRSEDLYGYILFATETRCRVRSCTTRSDWWYDNASLRRIDIHHVPEGQRAAVRPVWGDYVGLAAHHAQFGSAANGPMTTHDIGVVVGVRHTPDNQGGLERPCYTVRRLRTGQLYDYLEGALHLIPSPFIAPPLVPPGSGNKRQQKLQFLLSLLHADSGEQVTRTTVLSTSGEAQAAQVISPGKKYLIQATMKSKDKHVTLATLQPAGWDVYVQTGCANEFIHLEPTQTASPPCSSTATESSNNNGAGSTLDDTQHALLGRMLPLSQCAQASSGSSSSSNSLLPADGGQTGNLAVYDLQKDVVTCTFNWDSAETPLVTGPGRLTEVCVVSGVSFHGIKGVSKHTTTLLLRTEPGGVPAAGAQGPVTSNTTAPRIMQFSLSPQISGQQTEEGVYARRRGIPHPGPGQRSSGRDGDQDVNSDDHDSEESDDDLPIAMRGARLDELMHALAIRRVLEDL